jgi:MOSC domain-containing protein YiiM
MAHVSNLFIAVEHRKPMRAVDQVTALADRGFEGCIHGRPGSKRQVLLVDTETLAAFGLEPGIVRENVTTVGLDVSTLKRGQRLVIGDAVLEVTIPCEPCLRMDEIRMGLQETLKDRRGVLCRVIEGGRISRRDAIEIREAATAIPSVGGAR